MIVGGTYGEYTLYVRVRGKRHMIRLKKKDEGYYFTTIKPAPPGRTKEDYGYGH